MSIQKYLAEVGSKYLVVGKAVWEQDELAKSIAPTPRAFTIKGTEYVILSLDPLSIPHLEAYIVSSNGLYEFGFEQGNGKASFLTHSQTVSLLKTIEDKDA